MVHSGTVLVPSNESPELSEILLLSFVVSRMLHLLPGILPFCFSLFEFIHLHFIPILLRQEVMHLMNSKSIFYWKCL